jgi:hypothetical protein
MQTHTRPSQVARLVEVIKAGSPDSVVLISHDADGPSLDIPRLESLAGVHVITERARYGDFSHLDRYFRAVDWLDEHGVEFDWLENLTGQDYPLRPIAEIELMLANCDVDGFLLYAPVFTDRIALGADLGAAPEYQLCTAFDAAHRYRYRSWRIGRPTAAKQRWLRPVMTLNLVQPWVRASLGFSTVGLRYRHLPFTDEFICYGGSFFCTLSADCVHYARQFALDNPDFVSYMRTTLAPDEIFLQTALVNSGKFRLVPDCKRYFDYSQSRHNHPKTLGMSDLNAMLSSGAHWARKFDPERDADVLDALDQYVGRGCR